MNGCKDEKVVLELLIVFFFLRDDSDGNDFHGG